MVPNTASPRRSRSFNGFWSMRASRRNSRARLPFSAREFPRVITTVYLVRHGVTDWNVARRIAGRLPGIARIVGMPPARLRALEIGTASLSRLRRRDTGAVVDFANSRAHLAGPPGTDSPGEADQDRPARRPLR